MTLLWDRLCLLQWNFLTVKVVKDYWWIKVFSQTSALLCNIQYDRLHVHFYVKHQNNLSYPAITIWTISVINYFVPLACAEFDSSLPFSGASSIPLCYVLFLATLLHQLFFHPLSLHRAIYFLVYLSILFPTTSVRHKYDCFYGSVWPTAHDTQLWLKTADKLCYRYNKPLVYFWI